MNSELHYLVKLTFQTIQTYCQRYLWSQYFLLNRLMVLKIWKFVADFLQSKLSAFCLVSNLLQLQGHFLTKKYNFLYKILQSKSAMHFFLKFLCHWLHRSPRHKKSIKCQTLPKLVLIFLNHRYRLIILFHLIFLMKPS